MDLEHALAASAGAWLEDGNLPPERVAALERLVRMRSRILRRQRALMAAAAVALAGGLALSPVVHSLAASIWPRVSDVVRLVIPKGTPMWVSGGPVIALDVAGRRSDYGTDLWFDYRGYEGRDGFTWITLGIHGTDRAPQRVKEDFDDWTVFDREGGRFQAQVWVDMKQKVMTARVGAVVVPAELRAGRRMTIRPRDEVIELSLPPVGSEVRSVLPGGPVIDTTVAGRRSSWGDDLWFQYEGRSVEDGYTVLRVRIPDSKRAAERVGDELADWVVLGTDGQKHEAAIHVSASEPGWMEARLEGDVTPVSLQARQHVRFRIVKPNDPIRHWLRAPPSR